MDVRNHIQPRYCHRCLRPYEGEGPYCQECGARFRRLRLLDLATTTVLFLSLVFFGFLLAGSLGASVLDIDEGYLSSLMWASIVALFILVAVMVPILAFLFRREGA